MRTRTLVAGTMALAFAGGFLYSASRGSTREVDSILEIDYDKAHKEDVDNDGIADVIVNRGMPNEFAIDGRYFMGLKEQGYVFKDGLWRRR